MLAGGHCKPTPRGSKSQPGSRRSPLPREESGPLSSMGRLAGSSGSSESIPPPPSLPGQSRQPRPMGARSATARRAASRPRASAPAASPTVQGPASPEAERRETLGAQTRTGHRGHEPDPHRRQYRDRARSSHAERQGYNPEPADPERRIEYTKRQATAEQPGLGIDGLPEPGNGRKRFTQVRRRERLCGYGTAIGQDEPRRVSPARRCQRRRSVEAGEGRAFRRRRNSGPVMARRWGN